MNRPSIRHSRGGSLLGLLLSFVFVLTHAPAFAQAVDLDLWVPNGEINALIRSGDTLYAAGLFKNVGP